MPSMRRISASASRLVAWHRAQRLRGPVRLRVDDVTAVAGLGPMTVMLCATTSCSSLAIRSRSSVTTQATA